MATQEVLMHPGIVKVIPDNIKKTFTDALAPKLKDVKPVNQTTMTPVMNKPLVVAVGSSVMTMPVVQAPMTQNMTKPLVPTPVVVPVITNPSLHAVDSPAGSKPVMNLPKT